MGSRWSQVVVDALDPVRLAHWWAEVLGYQVLEESAGETLIGADATTWPQLTFVAVPDPKDGKNRVHLDLTPDDQDAEVERLLDMGARHVDIGQSQSASWVVLSDPEGNEFCVLHPLPP
jgi:catechol-2,3-dioxygenase